MGQINNISTGGAGGYGQGTSGRVSIQDPSRTRQYPWPLPGSAYQGAVGGAGGAGRVSVQIPPYGGPFQYYWPYGIPEQLFNGLPTNSVRT
jgi:hypothetical protein